MNRHVWAAAFRVTVPVLIGYLAIGIAFGLISYTFIALFTGKAREIKPATWIIVVLFALTFFLTH